jgi:hypothetical protein
MIQDEWFFQARYLTERLYTQWGGPADITEWEHEIALLLRAAYRRGQEERRPSYTEEGDTR